MCFAKGQDVTFARLGFCAQEKARWRVEVFGGVIVFLRFLDGTEIVDEYECVLVVGIVVARSSLIVWAKVAFRIVQRQINGTGTFLLTSGDMLE